MRITKQLLRKCSVYPLEDVEYLDLSCKRIVSLEGLELCPRIHTLVLKENLIDAIRNVDCCKELWNVDLSANKVKSVQGIMRFPALGSLVLAYNPTLDWTELTKLSHMNLLSLTLVGCSKLDGDPHYRKHVIDLLPNLWMLDGQLITAAERSQVRKFFTESAASTHPVRHKYTSSFVPSTMKNLMVTGVFGERTTDLMSRFPIHCAHNIELDKKRLTYTAWLLENDLREETEYKQSKGMEMFQVPCLEALLQHRIKETEQCNMLLLLMVARLEFTLPAELMAATLETAKLSIIGDMKCSALFTLPNVVSLKVACLLLNAATIDRNEGKEGGLYSQLYLCLQAVLQSLYKRILEPAEHPCVSSIPTQKKSLYHVHYEHQQCLLASEVVHLMCLVPLFFDLLESNQHVLEMVAISTKNPHVGDVIDQLSYRVHDNGGDVWDLYHAIASYLLRTTTAVVFSRKRRNLPPSPSSQHLHHTSSLLMQPTRRSSPLPQRSLSAGSRSFSRRKDSHSHDEPDIGDTVLCSAKHMGRIIALPEPHVAVLQLGTRSCGSASLPDSYLYMDTNGLLWDENRGLWIKDDLLDDVIPSQPYSSPDPKAPQQRSPSPSLFDPQSRPQSKLEYIPEDLEAISSAEVLNHDNGQPSAGLNQTGDSEFRMRVDVSEKQTSTKMARPKTPQAIEEAKLNHQLQIIQQYNKTAKPQIHLNKEQERGENDALGLHQELLSDEDDAETLTVPSPHLVLPDKWRSNHSLPQCLFTSSTKPHSCQHTSSPLNVTPRSQSASCSTSFVELTPFNKKQSLSQLHSPIVLQAWSKVEAGAEPRQNVLTSTRISMNRKLSSPPRGPKSSGRRSSGGSARKGGSYVASPQSRPLSSSSSQSPAPPFHALTYAQQMNMVQAFSVTNKSKALSTRKLGDLKGLSIMGNSMW